LVILPFEEAFYRKWDFAVEYVGHPLVEVVEAALGAQAPPLSDKPIVALLPGSRRQEVAIKLPVMLEVSTCFPECQFIVAQAPSLEDDFFAAFLKAYPSVQTIRGHTYTLLKEATAAVVTSGTATLETALFGVPEVVCYKGSAISYQIARRLIRVKYISLVNLIMDKPVVKELIQQDMNQAAIRRELEKLLHDQEYRAKMKEDFRALKQLLQQGGDASAQAATSISRFLSK
jgi:lipid-A-disaccharide synthase